MMNPVPWLQMTNMISYQELVRTFPNTATLLPAHVCLRVLTPSLRNFSSHHQLCGSFVGSMSKRIMVTDKKTTE
ncbi:hypothetical protein SNB30_01245, partial [Escherichia coli]|uniref:hypothetical protein n=1 Tax=Escherichia coli TaxID=562 RepID=UPI001A91A361